MKFRKPNEIEQHQNDKSAKNRVGICNLVLGNVIFFF